MACQPQPFPISGVYLDVKTDKKKGVIAICAKAVNDYGTVVSSFSYVLATYDKFEGVTDEVRQVVADMLKRSSLTYEFAAWWRENSGIGNQRVWSFEPYPNEFKLFSKLATDYADKPYSERIPTPEFHNISTALAFARAQGHIRASKKLDDSHLELLYEVRSFMDHSIINFHELAEAAVDLGVSQKGNKNDCRFIVDQSIAVMLALKNLM